MSEEFQFMPHVRQRYPAWMECKTCGRKLHDHTEEEFRECHKGRAHLYSWIGRGRPSRLGGRPVHAGTRIILRAMAYLENTYGRDQAAEAIKLLWDRATDDPRPE